MSHVENHVLQPIEGKSLAFKTLNNKVRLCLNSKLKLSQ